jgi:phosphate/sulfate permease
MKHEPVITAGTITGIVSALIGVAVAFGVDLDETQTAAIIGAVGLLAPIVAAVVSRFLVVPASEVVALRRPGKVQTVAGQASPLADGTPVGVTAVGPPAH